MKNRRNNNEKDPGNAGNIFAPVLGYYNTQSKDSKLTSMFVTSYCWGLRNDKPEMVAGITFEVLMN